MLKGTVLKIKFVLLLIAPLSICLAQTSWEVDTTRIVSYADKFVVKLNVDSQTIGYKLQNSQDGSILQITPNLGNNLFVSLDYQFFGLSVGFSPSFLNPDNSDDLKGESSFSDFRFRAALGPWVQGFQISSIEGYYVENTQDFVPNWTEGVDPYIQLTDLKNQVYGMSTSYVFNPNFSFRNLLYNTEWQKMSAGSFIPTLFYSYDRLSFTLQDIKSKENIVPIRLALAYFYTFVVNENWFISGNLSPSFGVRFSKTHESLNNMESERTNTVFTRTLEGGANLGYASKKIVFGLGFTFDVNGYNEDKFNAVETNSIYGAIYFGYRFNTPGFIDRAYNKAAKKIGLD
jgi:hypothetical protein